MVWEGTLKVDLKSHEVLAVGWAAQEAGEERTVKSRVHSPWRLVSPLEPGCPRYPSIPRSLWTLITNLPLSCFLHTVSPRVICRHFVWNFYHIPQHDCSVVFCPVFVLGFYILKRAGDTFCLSCAPKRNIWNLWIVGKALRPNPSLGGSSSLTLSIFSVVIDVAAFFLLVELGLVLHIFQ